MFRTLYLTLIVFVSHQTVTAQTNTTLDQIPELKSLPDQTQQLQAQIDANRGNLTLSGSDRFRITAPLVFDLEMHGAVKVTAREGATLIMDGPGPALKLVGTHGGSASPTSFKAKTWNERMPIVSDIEILGAHPEADGIQLLRTVAPIINRVSVRWCRHGIHLAERDRNVVISDCHVYENSGIGIFLDNVNLHQINITNAHVSYNRQGGIVVQNGSVRNLQVAGCDIEGNMPDTETPTNAANVLIQLTEPQDGRKGSVAEVSITGCTIQHSANYGKKRGTFAAIGGANIRLAGKASYPIDSVTITGNILSDTTTNIDVDYADDIAITANNFFAPAGKNLTVTNANRVIVSGNTFNPRQFVRPGTIEFTNSNDCILSSSTIHAFAATDGAVVLKNCAGMTLNALSLTDCSSGIVLKNTKDTTISNCRVARVSDDKPGLLVDQTNAGITLTGNVFDISSVAARVLSD